MNNPTETLKAISETQGFGFNGRDALKKAEELKQQKIDLDRLLCVKPNLVKAFL